MAAASLRIIGAGLGRTGTHSLKVALERLLGGPCYHMVEVFRQPDHPELWRRAIVGEATDWGQLFEGYVATVDWPGAACWQEMADAHPDVPVLLSTRESADVWWTSASRTIFQGMARVAEESSPWNDMTSAMMRRFEPRWQDEGAAKVAYERHNAAVRAAVPAGRLVEWQAADGWEPLCDVLGVPVPDEPFPVTNTTAEFRSMMGLDG